MPSKEVFQQSRADILTCGKWNAIIISKRHFTLLPVIYALNWVGALKWTRWFKLKGGGLGGGGGRGRKTHSLNLTYYHRYKLTFIFDSLRQTTHHILTLQFVHLHTIDWFTCFLIHLKHEDFYNCQFLMANALASFLLMKRHSILYSFQSAKVTMQPIHTSAKSVHPKYQFKFASMILTNHILPKILEI